MPIHILNLTYFLPKLYFLSWTVQKTEKRMARGTRTCALLQDFRTTSCIDVERPADWSNTSALLASGQDPRTLTQEQWELSWPLRSTGILLGKVFRVPKRYRSMNRARLSFIQVYRPVSLLLLLFRAHGQTRNEAKYLMMGWRRNQNSTITCTKR